MITPKTELFIALVKAFAERGIYIVPVRETKETCTEPAYKGPLPRYGYNVKVAGVRHAVYVFYPMDDVKWVLRCALRQLGE